MFYPNGEFSLGLSNPVNYHNNGVVGSETRQRKGKKQTTLSKRMVRNGAYLMEKRVGRRCLTFFTATLPDSAADAIEAAGEDGAKLYAEADRQMMQWIRRQLEAAGVQPDIVGCVEVQPRRWERYGKVALHSHYVFQGKLPDGDWIINKDDIRNQWNKILSNVCGVEVESLASTRVEQVKKSAENYLAKYMSKSGKMTESIIEAGKGHLLPSHWWHCTNELRKLIRSMLIPISEDAGYILYGQREALKEQGILSWFYVHEIEMTQSHGEPFMAPVAFVAKLGKPEYIQMFT
jgi:hypothetical protein